MFDAIIAQSKNYIAIKYVVYVTNSFCVIVATQGPYNVYLNIKIMLIYLTFWLKAHRILSSDRSNAK